jgi:hypothetical protein
MTFLAPLITRFLRDHMPRQRGYSPHSCETYAHGFRLLSPLLPGDCGQSLHSFISSSWTPP